MTTKTARINVRLPEDDLRELEAIRERTGLQSVSDVVRDAIDAYLHDEAATWNSEKVPPWCRTALMEDVEMFIASGDASDISQAVTLALVGMGRGEEAILPRRQGSASPEGRRGGRGTRH